MKLIFALPLLGFASAINYEINCDANPTHVFCTDRTFSGSFATTIASMNEMGCWCYFDDDHGRGKGQPIDDLDGVCKTLHEGYECAMRDAEAEGTTCVPWEVAYVSAVGGATTTLQEACMDANPGNMCACRACTVEGNFVESLIAFFVIQGGSLNQANKHSNGFNPKTDCPIKAGGSGPSEKSCCGEYPNRFPFKTLGGDRSCCGSRTFSTLTLNCCDADASQVKFNC